MSTGKGTISGYNQFISDDGLVVFQVSRFGQEHKETFVFDGYDSMEKMALENRDIPLSVWDTLATMQSEANAFHSIV